MFSNTSRLLARLGCNPVGGTGLRAMSSQEILKVEVVDAKRGVGQMTMHKPPVNSLDRPMLSGIVEGVDKLEKDGCRGLIVTSNVDNIFSAGLNILDLYQQDQQDLVQYWTMVQEMFLRLYGTDMATVACITGAAPAGGCLVATCCDYRLMVDQPKAKIGLNESLVGIPVPHWMRMNYTDILGHRQSSLAIQLGTMFSAQCALQVGLVDEVASSTDELREKALAKLTEFLKVPDAARAQAKRIFAEPLLTYLSDRRQQDAELFASVISQPFVQKVIGKYLEALRGKKN